MWALGLTLAWFVAALVFRRVRKRRAAYGELAQFFERFPVWARRTELWAMNGVWLVLMLALSVPFRFMHDAIAGNSHGPGLESVIVTTVGCAVASRAPALLIANEIFVRVPALREANRRASEGLSSMTFETASRELWLMTLVTLPLGVAQASFGAYAPWER